MNHYVQLALGKVKEAKFKITPSRQMVIEFLAKSTKALSPYEIRNLLKKRGSAADVVTIYRILELLEKLGLVHKVLGLNGYIRCGMEEEKAPCHHYLLCKKCQKVEEAHGENLSMLQKKITKNQKFKVESHYLEFMGICKNCQRHST